MYSTKKIVLIPFASLVKLLILCIFISSCETSNLSELAIDAASETDPNTVPELVTYDNRASVIIDNACVECHNTVQATAGIILDSFEAAAAVAESGRMLARMTNTTNPMPPSGNLAQPLIDDIMQWIEDGILENDN